MSRAYLLLACTALATASACRPAEDRTEARQAGAEAAGGAAIGGGVGDPVKRGANKVTPETLPANLATVDADEPGFGSNTADVAERATSPGDSTSLTIPAQYRGRWGMVPADCTSTRGDAKGLLVIEASRLRFYESRATLRERRPAAATSFSGLFGFSGEGMTWSKVQTLTRSGDTLTRADDEGSYTYTRCPA